MGIQYRLPDNATRREREEAAAMLKAEAAETVAAQETSQRSEVSSSALVDALTRRMTEVEGLMEDAARAKRYEKAYGWECNLEGMRYALKLARSASTGGDMPRIPAQPRSANMPENTDKNADIVTG